MSADTSKTDAEPRILIVDDDPAQRSLLDSFLSSQGFRTLVVPSGERALEVMRTETVDMMVSDVRMPGLSGLEATRALRARGVTTPVVALTANAFEDDRRACLEAGMDDFLVKPLSPEALRAALGRWTGPGWTRNGRRAKVAS